MKDIQLIRRDYGETALLEGDCPTDPSILFERWLNEALKENILDCTAMVLSTIDKKGHPDARVVLLKKFDSNGFVFFTQYTSPKAVQAESTGVVSLNFYWHQLARQVRVRGTIHRVSREESVAYFATRPRLSRIAALATRESTVIASRDALESRVQEIADECKDKDIPCPDNWGGFRVVPTSIEFFQGRDNRLSDRIRYRKVKLTWKMERLAP